MGKQSIPVKKLQEWLDNAPLDVQAKVAAQLGLTSTGTFRVWTSRGAIPLDKVDRVLTIIEKGTRK